MLFLQPLADEKVITLLSRYRPEISGDERKILASLSEGSIGRAVDLADRGGAELYRDMLALLAELPKLDTLAVQRFADGIGRGGEDASANLRTAFDLMGGIVHRLAKSASGTPAALPDEHALAARAAARNPGSRPGSGWAGSARPRKASISTANRR
jgi:DNA polymerase-3 subunit delta'